MTDTNKKGLEETDVEQVTRLATRAAAGEGFDAMQRWSDDKRTDFCKVFGERSAASAYILNATADLLLEKTHRLQFISERAKQKAQESRGAHALIGIEVRYGNYYPPSLIGGRARQDLDTIAQERADEVFRSLPPLKSAVKVIKPDVAEKIEEIETRKEKLEELTLKLEKPEFDTNIRLSSVDQTMSIGDFRAMVKGRVKARNELVQQINDQADTLAELEVVVAKALYAGIPELSDAIVGVAVQHYERAKAMETMNRRVGEQVKFGDSQAATSLVKQFENDEATVSDSIKTEFAAALTRLQLSSTQVRKALKAKGKK
jgi:hypothetical protein